MDGIAAVPLVLFPISIFCVCPEPVLANRLSFSKQKLSTNSVCPQGTKAYYATITFTDSEIGRVLDAARALGDEV